MAERGEFAEGFMHGKEAVRIAEAEGHGEMAYEVGKYTLMGEGDKVLDSGKYVVWKRQDGQWKLHRDIWNSSQPALRQ